jgi:tRNA pseudouridine13 synthase
LFLKNWPYLTKELPGMPGVIKSRPEDFIVEEIPQYLPSGQGDHTYFMIEKKGITTLELVRRLARALGRSDRDFGYAGLKDAQAVTRQVMSLEHIDQARLESLSLPPGTNAKILWINRHSNKIKLGHLAGNKFRIKLRQVPPDALEITKQCLEILNQRGIPNYFGLQRFGMRGDSWILGRAILLGDFKEFCDQFCGRPSPVDRNQSLKARELYDKGLYELSADVWPPFFRDAKRCCRTLAARPDAYFKAFIGVDRKLVKLFLSAYQSYLFNEVLAQRIDTLDKIWTGDVPIREDNGAAFVAEDPAAEQPRADRFEISPSGPIYGYKLLMPAGEELKIEQEILDNEKITLDSFRNAKGIKLRGSRRAFRVQMLNQHVDSGRDDAGDFLSLQFDLTSGSYATAVLRELMKENLSSQIQALPE